jgi:hypothetical protein
MIISRLQQKKMFRVKHFQPPFKTKLMSFACYTNKNAVLFSTAFLLKVYFIMIQNHQMQSFHLAHLNHKAFSELHRSSLEGHTSSIQSPQALHDF